MSDESGKADKLTADEGGPKLYGYYILMPDLYREGVFPVSFFIT